MKKISFFLFLITSSLFAQTWVKTPIRDKWGDITNYNFVQSSII